MYTLRHHSYFTHFVFSKLSNNAVKCQNYVLIIKIIIEVGWNDGVVRV